MSHLPHFSETGILKTEWHSQGKLKTAKKNKKKTVSDSTGILIKVTGHWTIITTIKHSVNRVTNLVERSNTTAECWQVTSKIRHENRSPYESLCGHTPVSFTHWQRKCGPRRKWHTNHIRGSTHVSNSIDLHSSDSDLLLKLVKCITVGFI
jgi:hypothetical protein